MAYYFYDRLSVMDNTFLLAETPTTPMHVAAIEIFEAGPLRTAEGGIDIGKIRAAYAGALHRIPRYRQKLLWIPIENRPVWVDDPDFNLDYHVRHVSLPRPGGEEELRQVASRILANHLDRHKPLWEIWVVEGIEHDRFAIIAKTHHCMLDGSAGVEMAQVLLSPSPDAEIAKAQPWWPRAIPTPQQLVRDEAWRYATLPLRALRGLREFREEAGDVVAEIGARAKAMRDFFSTTTSLSSDTPINGSLSPHRRFDWLKLSLADVKAVRRKMGCTVNDVFMATVTGACREYLRGRGVALDDIVFRASTPVSLRSEDDHSQAGNRVSSWFVDLPVAEPDRAAQLEAIHAETQRLKESRQAMGMEMLMAAAEFAPSGILALGAGLAGGPVNIIVTNVPGPQFPLYILGSRMLAMIPEVPLIENVGLGIALMSYDGSVFWGFTADYDLVPDLEHFVALIDRSFAELAALAGVAISASAGSGAAARAELLPAAEAAGG
jgi:WS/DGAT/MGAT family acyltransferase